MYGSYKSNTVSLLYIRKNINSDFFLISESYKIVDMTAGKPLVIYNGHTFSKRGSSNAFLFCSMKDSVYCPAMLKLNDEGTIVFSCIDHNHPPPITVLTESGKYFKVIL